MNKPTVCLCVAVSAVCLWAQEARVSAQVDVPKGEWRAYASDKASSKYSPLDQIDTDNVAQLEIVWRQSTVPEAVRPGGSSRAPLRSQNTPLMVGGLLYISTGVGSVAALNATTGDVVWFDTPPAHRRRDASAWQRHTGRRVLE